MEISPPKIDTNINELEQLQNLLRSKDLEIQDLTYSNQDMVKRYKEMKQSLDQMRKKSPEIRLTDLFKVTAQEMSEAKKFRKTSE